MITPPHPLQAALEARVRLLATTLRPATIRQYQYTTRKFMAYLREHFPDVRRPSQLRRDPHILGWLEHLWTRPISFSGKPLAATTRAADLIRLRRLFDLLGDHPFPPPPGLLQSQDIPRPDQVLPRPLSPEEDERLRYKLLRHNDLLSTALLLTRLTGMRIGETVDLAANCLRHIEDDQWALHVPVGKLHTERWIPVDGQVRTRSLHACSFFAPCRRWLLPNFCCLVPRAAARSASTCAQCFRGWPPRQVSSNTSSRTSYVTRTPRTCCALVSACPAS